MINYLKILFFLSLFALLVGGNSAFARPNYNYINSNYIIVDSCDEYIEGPKRHQGFCECYGDPYYYCAFFQERPDYIINNNVVRVTVPLTLDKMEKNGKITHKVN